MHPVAPLTGEMIAVNMFYCRHLTFTEESTTNLV
jgi:hypothetical protein